MSSPTLSRSFLQGLPELFKQRHIDGLIQGFVNMVQTAATEGKTSYMYDPNSHRSHLQQHNPSMPVITNDDLISAFQRRFPDCDISYQEVWVDVNSNNRVLRKGITIDWS
jgi:hypothetical protein